MAQKKYDAQIARALLLHGCSETTRDPFVCAFFGHDWVCVCMDLALQRAVLLATYGSSQLEYLITHEKQLATYFFAMLVLVVATGWALASAGREPRRQTPTGQPAATTAAAISTSATAALRRSDQGGPIKAVPQTPV